MCTAVVDVTDPIKESEFPDLDNSSSSEFRPTLDELLRDNHISYSTPDLKVQKAKAPSTPKPVFESSIFEYERAPLTLHFYGDPFYILQEEGQIMIKHQKSSLSGCGDTLASAEWDMLETARIIADEYVGVPSSELDAGAIQLRNFLLRVI